MEIPKAARTHVIYQFIILTLLFMGSGYSEILPQRKIIFFLAFVPVFCYQMIVLSCCMELMPVPSWMKFLLPDNKEEKTNEKLATGNFIMFQAYA